MKRRILGILVIIMLLCSSMTVTSFAETTGEKALKDQIPEAVVLVEVDNAECKMIEKMTDLTVDIKLKDGRDVINVPVERVEEEGDDLVALWLGYSYDEIDAQIKADMAEFQKDYHLGSSEEFMMNILSTMLGADEMSKDLLAIFENYEIVINGIPENEDHEFKIETNTMLITSTIVSELFDIATELVGSLFDMKAEEIAKINNFSDIVDLLNSMLLKEGMLENGKDIYDFILELAETDEITKAELVEAVAEMDAVLEYMQSEEYTGTVFAGVYMNCECPYTVEFEIYHQYFKEVDGKMTLAGTVNFGPYSIAEEDPELAEIYDYDFEMHYYKGLSTDVVKSEDYICTEYNGEKYRFAGSYSDETLIYPDQSFFWTDEKDYDTLDDLYSSKEWWSEHQYNQLDLDTEDWDAPMGLVLRYELLENNSASNDNISNDEEDTAGPQTGDDSNMMPFYIIMMIALLVMAVAAVTRRKQEN